MKNKYEYICADNLQYLPSLESESIQLIVTSPPYNVGKDYEKKTHISLYLENQDTIIRECFRLLKKGGSICWQVGTYVESGEVFPLDILLYSLFKKYNFSLRNRIIWHFEHGLHCKYRLSGRHETILWFTKGDDYIFHLDPIRIPQKYREKKYYKGPNKGKVSSNPLGKNPGDVWLIPNVKSNHVEKTEHPCQFPVELAERLVLSLTDPEDIVLDPYAGVASTLIAATKHDRLAKGCEINSDYVEIGTRRLQNLITGALKTRPIGRIVPENRKID